MVWSGVKSRYGVAEGWGCRVDGWDVGVCARGLVVCGGDGQTAHCAPWYLMKLWDNNLTDAVE